MLIILHFCVSIGVMAQNDSISALSFDELVVREEKIQIKGNDSIMSVNLPTTFKNSILFYDNLRDSVCKCYDDTNTPLSDSPIMMPIYPFGAICHYSPVYDPSFVNSGVIYQGNNIVLSGTVDVAQYPGMMNNEVGMLGTSFGKERLHFYIGGIVNKYGFYGGQLRQLGIVGQFTYQLSSPVSFTAFAHYYDDNVIPLMPNGEFMPPSMLGYYDVSRFGGYINYKASEHFGIQMGGQVVERIGPRNHYEVEPIVTPYISVGRGKKKIVFGLPVGQILYGIFNRYK